jgi:hypothetical protein
MPKGKDRGAMLQEMRQGGKGARRQGGQWGNRAGSIRNTGQWTVALGWGGVAFHCRVLVFVVAMQELNKLNHSIVYTLTQIRPIFHQ